MRFQVFVATNVKIAVFWDMAHCSLVETDRYFRGDYCLYHQAIAITLVMEAVSFYHTAPRYVPEHSRLQLIVRSCT
jgi:hypothetical protein